MAYASVLVVDDDAAAVASAGAVLSAAGYAVFNAKSGRLALNWILTSPPDVVITTILMPDGDGIELITAVKGGHPGLPIVAVSERRFLGGLDLFHLAKKLGADAVLDKPIEGGELLTMMAGLTGPPGRP